MVAQIRRALRSNDYQQALLLSQKTEQQLGDRRCRGFRNLIFQRLGLSRTAGRDCRREWFRCGQPFAVRALLADALSYSEATDMVRACYAQLLRTAPESAESYVGFAAYMRQQGDIGSAVALINQALLMNPMHIPYMAAGAMALAEGGLVQQAIALFEQGAQARPSDPAYWSDYGLVMCVAGDWDQGLGYFRRALELAPGDSEYLYKLADALQKMSLNHRWQALTLFRQIVDSDPEHIRARIGLGFGLLDFREIEEASQQLDIVLSLEPDNPVACIGKAQCLSQLGDSQGAVELCSRALELRGDYPEGHNNLGLLQMDAHQYEQSRLSFYRALQQRPDYPEARYHLALLNLLEGDLENGFPDHELRWDASTLKGNRFDYGDNLWTGQPLAGKTLLVYTEQGFGDSIQFIRYLNEIPKDVDKIILHCQPQLAKLFGDLSRVDEVLVRAPKTRPADMGKGLPAYDYQAALMSLPMVLNETMAALQQRSLQPYLRSRRPAGPNAGKSVNSGALKVGLAWHANPTTIRLSARNMQFTDLQPVWALEGVFFCSLQFGEVREQASAWFADGTLTDLTGSAEDFADTALLLESLDLVISVDTGLVHLCGAMGVPVWVMLPYSADWRWFIDRLDSPWYPSMRLYRQSAPGEWATVVQSVAEDLHIERTTRDLSQG